jgi:hypothetical protein
MRGYLYEERAMHHKKRVTTTLGELIVAVTDEVNSYVDVPSVKYAMVSVVLSDLFARDRVRLDRLARELEQEEAEYRSAS